MNNQRDPLEEAYRIINGDFKPASNLEDAHNIINNVSAPTHFEFLRSGASNTDTRSSRQYRTSLKMDPRQRAAEQAARTEVSNSLKSFRETGVLDEFRDYERREGKTLAGSEWLGSIDTTFEDLLSPAFDLLQASQFATTGFVQELLRTNSAYEAFKQAGVEFSNAMPGLESSEARRPSWGDILDPEGDDPWVSAVGGFALDVLLDPLNLLPGGFILKGISKIPMASKGAQLFTKSRPGTILRQKFVADADLKDLGEPGEALIQVRKEFEQNDIDTAFHVVEAANKQFANSTPHERMLLRAYFDQPQILEQQLKRIVDAGGPIQADRIPSILKTRDIIAEQNERLWTSSVLEGWFDSAAFRENYIYEGTPSRFSNRALDKQGRHSTPSVRGTPKDPSFGKARKHKDMTTEERLTKIMEENGIPIELDIAATQVARTLEQARISNSREFIKAVVSNPKISAKVVDVLPNGKPLWSNDKMWKEFKNDIENTPGYSILTIKQHVLKKKEWVSDPTHVPAKGEAIRKIRKTLTPKEILSGEALAKTKKRTVAAYVLPTEIVDEVNRMEKLWSSGDEITKLVNTVEKATSIWRGLATLSTGFHVRNYTGMLSQNWLAGVGTDYKKWLKGDFPVPGQFLHRHIQALKLQVMDQGPGALPKRMQKALKLLGVEDLNKVKIDVKYEGKNISAEKVLAMGRKEGVPQSATRLENLPEDFEGQFLTKFERALGKKPAKLGPEADITPVTRMLLEAEPGESFTTRAIKWFGIQNPVLKTNRALGQIVENNGRWALFLDRLMKGETAQKAKAATTTWHYDYRNITEWEKKVMRNILPFYAWMRFNTPRQFHALMNNPGKYAKLPKLKDAIERLSPDWDDIPTPDYFEEIHAIQTGRVRNDKPLYLRPDLPVLDINRVNFKDVMSNLTPLLKAPFESVSREGYSIFLGGSQASYPSQVSKEIPWLSKKAQFALETALPPVGKYYTRPTRAAERGELPEWAASEFLGIKMMAVDTRRVTRGKTFKTRKLAREFKRKLRDEGRMSAQSGNINILNFLSK